MKEFLAGLMERASRFIIGLLGGDFMQLLEGHSVLEEGFCVGRGLELLVRRHPVFVAVTLGDAALVVHHLLREKAGAMEVEVRRQHVAGEVVDPGGVTARDMAVAEMFADDGAVFAFDQGVVVGVAGAGLGEFLDLEFVEEPRDAMVDGLGAVIGMEGAEGEGKGQEERFQDRKCSLSRSTAAMNWNGVTSSTALMRYSPLMPPRSPWWTLSMRS